jgi:enamine deaminase RidA (YjgF/YER057c/UK114 family)
VSALDRLASLGLELPQVPTPAAAYRPWAQVGSLIHTAGQLPLVDGALPRTGKLGRDLTTAEGAELGRRIGLNLLAVAAAAAGDLDRVRTVKLTVFVASDPSFTEQHLVANGVSELLAAVLGDAGLHARSAVGVPSLPLDSPVEAEAIFELLGG